MFLSYYSWGIDKKIFWVIIFYWIVKTWNMITVMLRGTFSFSTYLQRTWENFISRISIWLAILLFLFPFPSYGNSLLIIILECKSCRGFKSALTWLWLLLFTTFLKYNERLYFGQSNFNVLQVTLLYKYASKHCLSHDDAEKLVLSISATCDE